MKMNIRQRLYTALTAIVCFLFAFPFLGNANLPLKTAAAYEDNYIEIQRYNVEMTIGKDRQVRVEEEVTVHYLHTQNLFSRAFPIETARFYDISASCPENPEFSYYVADHEEIEGFFEIVMTGNTERGNTWTYRIGFTMENGLGKASWENGMLIDVVPFGSTVAYHNVTATVHFPYAVSQENCILYKGLNSTSDATDLNKQLSADGKTLTFGTAKLPVTESSDYGYTVQGVTLEFTMDGTFDGYVKTRLFTDAIWLLAIGGIVAAALAVVVRFITKKPRDLVTVVNFTAPDEMDPMTMGKTLDGTVDNEDVTSMIYYFAHKGWLTIDLTDEDDPILNRTVENLPAGTPAHAKTLFKGLFASGESVTVSDLKHKFYEYVDKARLQTKRVKMYDKKSVIGYVLGGVLGLALSVLSVFILGIQRLSGYTSGTGMIAIVPIGVHLALGWVRENYRYKWKRGAQLAMRIGIAVVELIFAALFMFLVAPHVATEFEKLVIILFAYACMYVTENVLSRREDYLEKLGHIIGFKDFIIHTEEDKIKFMLEENPQLYYKILPYAQVLGVTDEWEKKFENILLEPPYWCYGTNMSTFDYYIIHRSMTRAMATAMQRPESKGGGGSSAGSGSFGSFGGGGFGGGGFGSR